jgi:hypothetical protein
MRVVCSGNEGVEFSDAVVFVVLDMEAEGEWIGCSRAIERRVSAPTIPPMECPIRIVWTEGSTVGEGVEEATSRSMTLFWSLRDHIDQLGRACESPRPPFLDSPCMEGTYHSLNLETHSFKSPLVSNFGYVIACTSTFGKACCRIAFRWEGKLPNVSSPP